MLFVSVLIGLIFLRLLLFTTRTLYCYEVDPRVADQCHLSSGNICSPFSRQAVGQGHGVMKKSIEIKKSVPLGHCMRNGLFGILSVVVVQCVWVSYVVVGGVIHIKSS